MPEAIARIELLISGAEPTYVVTPNVDHLVKLQHDAAFRAVYDQAALVLADGMPLLWAARYLRTPLKAKVSGSDLFPAFCKVAADKDYRLFFMGGQPSAAGRCAEILRARHPGIKIVGTLCPPFGFEKDRAQNNEIIAAIRSAQPHVLFVGLGAPKQELWIAQHAAACAVPVSIGVGASFDFVAGIVRRAPRPLQKIGLEWLWRLLCEPRRLYRRYLIEDPKFVKLIWQQRRSRVVDGRHDLSRPRQPDPPSRPEKDQAQ